MISKTEAQARLTFYQSALTEMRAAYIGIINGGVKSYILEGDEITNLDVDKLLNAIEKMEGKVDKYSALVKGGKPRKAFRINPTGL